MATFAQRESGWWQAKIRMRGQPLASKTFPTRALAEAWAKVTEAAMLRGHYIARDDAEKTTLHDLIERYRSDVLPTKRGKHFAPSLNVLDEKLGKLALSAITSKRVAAFRDERTKAGLSASTVKKEINLLSKLIDLAGKEWGIALAANPCAMVTRPTENNARDRRLQPDEERYLLASCGGAVTRLARLALETAARLGELLALRWVDVDLGRRVMLLRGIDGRGTKNGDAVRAVPLSSAAVSVFDELKDLPRSIDGRVFYQWKASDSFSKTWVRVVARARAAYLGDCAAAGREPDGAFLVDLRFHDLRHEAVSRLFERGVFDSMEVASITGHKTIAMLKRYTHLRPEDLAKKLG
ncbi:MAG: site-specific integrase [Candidatus Thermoplasmatota archaeon]|nr:site-specific integrase [Candidatus Thermoplasmatota archaeon]